MRVESVDRQVVSGITRLASLSRLAVTGAATCSGSLLT